MLPKLLSQQSTETTNNVNNSSTMEMCTLCGVNKRHQKVDLSANEEMKHTLNALWNVPGKSVAATLTAICVQCVYKLNAHKEMTRSFEFRLKRRLNGNTPAPTAEAPPPPPAPPAKKDAKISKAATRKAKTATTTTAILAPAANKPKMKKHKTGRTPSKRSKTKKKKKKFVVQVKIEAPDDNVTDTPNSNPPDGSLDITPILPTNSTTANSDFNTNTPATQLEELASPPGIRSDGRGSHSSPAEGSPLKIFTVTAGSAHSSPDTRDVSITPPPYSPHETSQESLEHAQPAAVGAPTEPHSVSPRPTYVVQVEDITPEKDSLKNAGNLTSQNDGPAALEEATQVPPEKTEAKMAEHDELSSRGSPHRIVEPDIVTSTPLHRSETPRTSGTPAGTPVAASLKALSEPRPESPHSLVSSTAASQGNNNNSMLKVVCERPESILVTESGGCITRHTVQPLVCPYCSRAYWRNMDAVRHARRCSARLRFVRARNLSASAGAGPWNGRDTEEEVADAGNAKSPSKTPAPTAHSTTTSPATGRNRRIFHCPDCAVTVESTQKLREHRRIHLQRYYCDVCGREFTAPVDFEFHRVICAAKAAASEVQRSPAASIRPADGDESGGATVEASAVAMPAVAMPAVVSPPLNMRVTRSRSRAASMRAPSIAAKPAASPKPKASVARSVQVKRSKEAATTAARRAPYSLQGGRTPTVDDSTYFGFEDDDASDDDGDDAASAADSMYTKRMRFTGNWLHEQTKSPDLCSLCDDHRCDYDEDLQISTYKEYDLYLLERLKAQMHIRSFTCLVPHCDFFAPTLLDMMLHDYVHHFKRAWFYCRKCGCVFTSKVFLDYHLDRQNGGRFICFKCGVHFQFQHILDRHLIRHTKSINYRCNYCNFEFLTEHELLQHCEREQHHPNGERKLIQIQPNMTIVNELPERFRELPARRGNIYNVHVREMQTLHISTKNQPTPLSDHKPFGRQIGDVEFKNQKNPNCWGWKK